MTRQPGAGGTGDTDLLALNTLSKR